MVRYSHQAYSHKRGTSQLPTFRGDREESALLQMRAEIENGRKDRVSNTSRNVAVVGVGALGWFVGGPIGAAGGAVLGYLSAKALNSWMGERS